MKWMLVFRCGAEYAYIRAVCAEEDLFGEKEAAAMRLEEQGGGPWICVTVLPVEAEG